MFTTIPSLAISPTALSLPPAVLAVTASDAVSLRQTSVALAAPLSNQPAADNTQYTLPVTIAPLPENIPQANTNANSSANVGSNLNITGPSSSFLAQLFSQSAEQNDSTAIATNYARFAPAPEYNTFVGYGFIKYKPSEAGLPPQRSPLPSPVTVPFSDADTVTAQDIPGITLPVPVTNNAAVPAVTVAANDLQAYVATSSRNQSNLSIAQPQWNIDG